MSGMDWYERDELTDLRVGPRQSLMDAKKKVIYVPIPNNSTGQKAQLAKCGIQSCVCP